MKLMKFTEENSQNLLFENSMQIKISSTTNGVIFQVALV
jgi:hypothetical protein